MALVCSLHGSTALGACQTGSESLSRRDCWPALLRVYCTGVIWQLALRVRLRRLRSQLSEARWTLNPANLASAKLQPTQRFSDRVDNYVRFRPGYPPAVIQLLAQHCALAPYHVVADIGSGTGLLARLFLENGNRVAGVEPNAEMRTAAERLLAAYPGFTSVVGRAEATGLADAGVDFVAVGQAFHWFDRQAAGQEFVRILRPGGWIVLVWNSRQTHTTPFLASYEQLLRTYATDYVLVDHTNIGLADLQQVFGPDLRLSCFENQQVFDYTGVEGRLLSSSYAPMPGQPSHREMLAELRRIFDAYQTDGQVQFRYTTEVYYVQV